MSRVRLFVLKNTMLFSNIVSNIIGVAIVIFLAQRSHSGASSEMIALGKRLNLFFIPSAFMLPFIIILLYERPIRHFLEIKHFEMPVSPKSYLKAKKRLLNEPFFVIAIDLGIWLLAAGIYPLAFWRFGADRATIKVPFFLSLYTGLITITVAFFLLERLLQKRLVPHLFPEGGLFMTPGTLRIRISTRLAALVFACNIIPFFTFFNTVNEAMDAHGDPAEALSFIRSTLSTNSILFMGVGIWLTILVSTNLRKPLEEIIRVLQGVRKGAFDNKVRVTSNDEIGYAGDVINEMTEGLKERDFIKETFGRYVTNEIRDVILSGKVPLDGETKEVTVLFADLRNFTPMVESIPPKEVVKIINSYFREMEAAINGNKGLVLQYIGDEIEAVFGAPLYYHDHPEMAVKAALEMIDRLRTVNRDLKARGFPLLSHGIGIHTGEVVAANIGSPSRLSYALVGDTVNLASRLQSLNKEFDTEIIISKATRERLDSGYPFKQLPPQRVKGKSHEVEIFTLPGRVRHAPRPF